MLRCWRDFPNTASSAATWYLKDALRDRFVCGLKCETVQKRLLTEKDLTFQKAVDHAVSAETAACDVQQLSSSLKVNAVFPQRTDKCHRCGKPNHTDDDCWYKDRDCHRCRRKGHTKRMCRSKAKSSQDREHKQKDRKPEQKGNASKHNVKDKKKKIHHSSSSRQTKVKVKKLNQTLIVIWDFILCLKKGNIHAYQ